MTADQFERDTAKRYAGRTMWPDADHAERRIAFSQARLPRRFRRRGLAAVATERVPHRDMEVIAAPTRQDALPGVSVRRLSPQQMEKNPAFKVPTLLTGLRVGSVRGNA